VGRQHVHHYAAISALDDAQHLESNLRAVAEQRELFAKELPQWQSVAAQWSRFVGSKDAPLIPGSNDADVRSAAP
jgi:histidinol-phosphate/aromatic aminotransferase/cobyric acid decarboxylase-like protein